VQRLARGAIEVAELWEEVTRAWVAAVMVEARAAQAEKISQERSVLLATAHGEADMVARRVSVLESELVATHRAWDVAEEKLPSLAAKAATADW
jgi:hypothetical protein